MRRTHRVRPLRLPGSLPLRPLLARAVPALCLCSALALAGCSPLRAGLPEGFAELEGRGLTYRAVSPEGVRYRVRVLANRPAKELAFWSEALRSQLVKEGYRPNGEAMEFDSGGRTGVLYEWAAPYGNESYLYLTALVVSKRRIALAEAAAPYPLFVQYREALRRSLESLRLR